MIHFRQVGGHPSNQVIDPILGKRPRGLLTELDAQAPLQFAIPQSEVIVFFVFCGNMPPLSIQGAGGNGTVLKLTDSAQLLDGREQRIVIGRGGEIITSRAWRNDTQSQPIPGKFGGVHAACPPNSSRALVTHVAQIGNGYTHVKMLKA